MIRGGFQRCPRVESQAVAGFEAEISGTCVLSEGVPDSTGLRLIQSGKREGAVPLGRP